MEEEKPVVKKRGRPPKALVTEETDESKKARGAVTEDDKFEAMAKKVDQLTDLVTALGERVLNTPQPPPELPRVPSQPDGESKQRPATSDLSGIVPRAWRAVVDEELGADFDLEVSDSSSGNMMLKIILPYHLDRRVGDKDGRDHSMGLIRRASDLSDVEHWCQKVRANIQKTYPNFKK